MVRFPPLDQKLLINKRVFLCWNVRRSAQERVAVPSMASWPESRSLLSMSPTLVSLERKMSAAVIAACQPLWHRAKGPVRRVREECARNQDGHTPKTDYYNRLNPLRGSEVVIASVNGEVCLHSFGFLPHQVCIMCRARGNASDIHPFYLFDSVSASPNQPSYLEEWAARGPPPAPPLRVTEEERGQRDLWLTLCQLRWIICTTLPVVCKDTDKKKLISYSIIQMITHELLPVKYDFA